MIHGNPVQGMNDLDHLFRLQAETNPIHGSIKAGYCYTLLPKGSSPLFRVGDYTNELKTKQIN